MIEKALEQKPRFYNTMGFMPKIDRSGGFSSPSTQIAPITEYLNKGNTIFRNRYTQIPLLIGIGVDNSTSIVLQSSLGSVVPESQNRGVLIKRKSSSIVDDDGLVADNARIVSVIDLEFIANIRPYARE